MDFVFSLEVVFFSIPKPAATSWAGNTKPVWKHAKNFITSYKPQLRELYVKPSQDNFI